MVYGRIMAYVRTSRSRFTFSVILFTLVGLWITFASGFRGVGGDKTDLKQLLSFNPLRQGINGWSAATGRRGCGVCDVAPELCEEYGEAGIARAMSYMGSGDRVKRFIVKARQGKGFNVGSIGGSVSKGFGVDVTNTDNLYTHTNLHRIIFDHLNELFPAPNGVVNRTSGRETGQNGYVNGALGGTGTDYFSMCFKEHIPQDVDLVITELAINDERLMRNLGSFELLIRGLLDLPEQPAIINLQVLALFFPEISVGGDLHMGVAQYYDLPVVSLRNLLLPSILADTKLIRKWFMSRAKPVDDSYSEVDLRHISKRGHALSGALVNAYIDTQVCEVNAFEVENGPATLDDFPLPLMPRLRVGQKYNMDKTTPKISPECMSMSSRKHPLVPASNTGWREWKWEEKKYLVADEPGSIIAFDINTSLGKVEITYLRSNTYGLGSVDCWVDDDRASAKRVDGWWEARYNIARTQGVASGLSEGKHTLKCELRQDTRDPGGGKEFRLISVQTI